MRLLTRRDFLTRKPLMRGGEPRPRVNHGLLNQRLNRIFDAIDRADTLVRFFEKPEPPPGGKRPVQRSAANHRQPGMTKRQLVEMLGCKGRSLARALQRAGVVTPKRGEHGRQYTLEELQQTAHWCLGQSFASYVSLGESIRDLLESAARARNVTISDGHLSN